MIRLLPTHTQHKKHVVLDTVLKGLYGRYLQRVPQAQMIVDHIASLQEQHEGLQQSKPTENMTPRTIENDHIAFRSLLLSSTNYSTGIAYLEQFFVNCCGYTKRDAYQFEEKKLNAYWYAPPNDSYPRIFISELRVHDLTERAQAILREATYYGPNSIFSLPDGDENEEKQIAIGKAIVKRLQTPIFNTITWEKYETLQQESEYAAWVYGMNSHEMNHLTIAVHNLWPPPWNDLQKLNEMISTQLGIALNQPNAPIQTSPDGLLLQSSTVAAPMNVTFADDGVVRSISGSYVEFAERRVLPEFVNRVVGMEYSSIPRRYRREGFEASNANVIFESTFEKSA